MPQDRLRTLCEGFCAIAKVAVPPMHQQQEGLIAFNIAWRDVRVDITARPTACADHAFALFEFGLPAAEQAHPVQVLLTLMHMNFMSLRVNQAVFSCHPETNAVVLQVPVPLAETTPAGLHQLIEEGVSMALRWRETCFLPAAPQHANGTMPDQYA